MALDIGFFDMDKVGNEAKRLATCFNLSAAMTPRDGNPLGHAEDLFTQMTGLAVIPQFNEDEQNYLKLKLVETAADINRGSLQNMRDLEEAAGVLHATARQMKLLR
ncbi:MAG TPA: hypothetical protein VEF76_01300 [Patescibacteria group bacterium]|nr:hypothetical protein [Patescibacteria group bacterium]